MKYLLIETNPAEEDVPAFVVVPFDRDIVADLMAKYKALSGVKDLFFGEFLHFKQYYLTSDKTSDGDLFTAMQDCKWDGTQVLDYDPIPGAVADGLVATVEIPTLRMFVSETDPGMHFMAFVRNTNITVESMSISLNWLIDQL